jgi:hypothetical protein
MALDERVDGIPVADGVDDCTARVAERDAAAGGRDRRGEALIRCPRAGVPASSEEVEAAGCVVPMGTVASVTSLVPAAERYASLKPPMSAAAVPVFAISTNSFEAAPVEPVISSFRWRVDVPPPPEVVQVMVATPLAS